MALLQPSHEQHDTDGPHSPPGSQTNARSSIIPTVHNDDEVFGRHSASQGIFVTEMDKDKPLRIPAPLRHHVEQLFKFTDPFCGEHLDAEYAELIRKLIAKLARKRPSPLVRGDAEYAELIRDALRKLDPEPAGATRVKPDSSWTCASPSWHASAPRRSCVGPSHLGSGGDLRRW